MTEPDFVTESLGYKILKLFPDLERFLKIWRPMENIFIRFQAILVLQIVLENFPQVSE